MMKQVVAIAAAYGALTCASANAQTNTFSVEIEQAIAAFKSGIGARYENDYRVSQLLKHWTRPPDHP